MNKKLKGFLILAPMNHLLQKLILVEVDSEGCYEADFFWCVCVHKDRKIMSLPNFSSITLLYEALLKSGFEEDGSWRIN